MNIGLIGAQSFHSKAFSQIFNRDNLFPGCKITAICGSDDIEKRDELVSEYGIINCLETEAEVIDTCDAVLITYRLGEMHAAPAITALKAGKPCFIDKPLVRDSAEMAKIIAASKEGGVPFCGGTTLKELPAVKAIKNEITPGATVIIDYNADPESPFGGYAFYGAHSAELLLFLCGIDYENIAVSRSGRQSMVLAKYADRQGVLVASEIKEELDIAVSGAFTKNYNIKIGDAYIYMAKKFINMIKTRELPDSYEFHSKTVELINEIERGL